MADITSPIEEIEGLIPPQEAETSPVPDVSVNSIFRLWLPLAVSFELMMLEGPSVQGAISRLPAATLNLAAWGLAFSLALLVESPVIMLLATAIALVRDEDTYKALRRFVVNLMVFCTLLTALIAFTPLFDLIAAHIMGQPAPIVAAARPALQIMLLWTAAIAWRRFYQGVLVRAGQTRLVSLGTAVRLTVTLGVVGVLLRWSHLSGVVVGAITLMAAVIMEAIAVTWFALPIARRHLLGRHSSESVPLTQKAIFQFHTPLAATTLLTLLAPPLTSAALARLAMPQQTLAAWPVASMLLLVLRGPGLALQEIAVSQSRRPEARNALRRFTTMVGLVSMAITLLLALTPLLDRYMGAVLHLPAELRTFVRVGVVLCSPLPLLTTLGSWARGVLVATGRTPAVYRGMGVNLTTHGTVLLTGIVFHLPGMAVAAVAFLLSAGFEYLFLVRLAVRIPHP
ncbi:MAG: hypothetical protein JWN14_3303 [Chthonomonadales bacterium]|nr:hypothetical protein [Chthonomonadales bacterium]